MSQPTEEHPDPREEYVDGPLQVALWWTPTKPKIKDDIAKGAPEWWHGEAAASEEFFRSMKIQLTPDGQVIKR